MPSSLNIIKIILALVIACRVNAQDQRMDRLALQYRSIKTVSQKEKNDLQLLIVNKYLEEGNYESAVNLNDKIPADSDNVDLKNFLSGKAEFLADNYNGSLSFLYVVNEKKINEKFYPELQLYKLLNYNHLFFTDSTYLKLSALFLKAGKDTTGMREEIRTLMPPKFLDLKKTRRRSLIFPGAGLAYVGEKRKAFGSAFMSIAFLGYTAYSVYSKYYITAALTGISQFLRFYHGGQRASIKTAIIKNREAYLNYILKLDSYTEKKLFELYQINR